MQSYECTEDRNFSVIEQLFYVRNGVIIIEITKDQRIRLSITFLESNGYIVTKDYSKLIGKWAAFRQEGMQPILHGKVKDISFKGCCSIKCKNGYMRYVNVNEVIEFCDDKQLCYMIK